MFFLQQSASNADSKPSTSIKNVAATPTMSKKKSDLMFKKGGPISKVPVSFVASGQLSTVDAPETRSGH